LGALALASGEGRGSRTNKGCSLHRSAKSNRKKTVHADTSVVAEGFEKGMTGQKIADTIGCSLSTVWRHKAKLREESAEL
jgi:DNA invertase Pin-like site-specific DNA recombinase